MNSVTLQDTKSIHRTKSGETFHRHVSSRGSLLSQTYIPLVSHCPFQEHPSVLFLPMVSSFLSNHPAMCSWLQLADWAFPSKDSTLCYLHLRIKSGLSVSSPVEGGGFHQIPHIYSSNLKHCQDAGCEPQNPEPYRYTTLFLSSKCTRTVTID